MRDYKPYSVLSESPDKRRAREGRRCTSSQLATSSIWSSGEPGPGAQREERERLRCIVHYSERERVVRDYRLQAVLCRLSRLDLRMEFKLASRETAFPPFPSNSRMCWWEEDGQVRGADRRRGPLAMTLRLAASHPLLPLQLTIAIHTYLYITHSLYRNAVRSLCRCYTFVACGARGRALQGLADDFRNASVRERWTRSESRIRLRSSNRNNIADVVPPSLV